jgi:hypothetical protein
MGVKTAKTRLLLMRLASGVVTTIVGSAAPTSVGNFPGHLPASMLSPDGVAIDSSTGNLYITLPDAVMVAVPPKLLASITCCHIIGVAAKNLGQQVAARLGLAIGQAHQARTIHEVDSGAQFSDTRQTCACCHEKSPFSMTSRSMLQRRWRAAAPSLTWR